jgi:hypothetical protein
MTRYISDEYDPEPPDRPSRAEIAADEHESGFDSGPTKRAVYRDRRGTSGRGHLTTNHDKYEVRPSNTEWAENRYEERTPIYDDD